MEARFTNGGWFFRCCPVVPCQNGFPTGSACSMCLATICSVLLPKYARAGWYSRGTKARTHVPHDPPTGRPSHLPTIQPNHLTNSRTAVRTAANRCICFAEFGGTTQRKIHPPTTHRPIQYSNTAVRQHVRQYTGTRGLKLSWLVIECGGPGRKRGEFRYCVRSSHQCREAGEPPPTKQPPPTTHPLYPGRYLVQALQSRSCSLCASLAVCTLLLLLRSRCKHYYPRGYLNSTHGTTSIPRPHHHTYAAGKHAGDEGMDGTRTGQPLYASVISRAIACTSYDTQRLLVLFAVLFERNVI